MKALTVSQPWASLIVHGEKTIEIRSWRTKHRGWLLIHAGKRYEEAERLHYAKAPIRQRLRAHGIRSELNLTAMRGKIIGIVKLTDCVPVESLDSALIDRNRDFAEIPPMGWAWLLSDASPFRAMTPLRGALGVYEVADEWIELGQHPAGADPAESLRSSAGLTASGLRGQ